MSIFKTFWNALDSMSAKVAWRIAGAMMALLIMVIVSCGYLQLSPLITTIVFVSCTILGFYWILRAWGDVIDECLRGK